MFAFLLLLSMLLTCVCIGCVSSSLAFCLDVCAMLACIIILLLKSFKCVSVVCVSHYSFDVVYVFVYCLRSFFFWYCFCRFILFELLRLISMLFNLLCIACMVLLFFWWRTHVCVLFALLLLILILLRCVCIASVSYASFDDVKDVCVLFAFLLLLLKLFKSVCIVCGYYSSLMLFKRLCIVCVSGYSFDIVYVFVWC